MSLNRNRNKRKTLREVVELVEGSSKSVPPKKSGEYVYKASRVFYGVAKTEITAMSGNKLGKGEFWYVASAYVDDPDDADFPDIELTTMDEEETGYSGKVYSRWNTSILTGTNLVISEIDGHLSVIGADCP